MIEEKFKLLEANVFKLLSENTELKLELAAVQERFNQHMAETAEAMQKLETESLEAIQTLQTESVQAMQTLQDESAVIQSRNAELTMHLKKIMSRLESLGVQ